ncbi:MAG: prolipoprotein diacylglyceryl transferase [Candidatus Omnitrophica bacterium]|nr:prolipoprotein diacylglyceryl transferase [Candidatus Omnitrophota bacterium]MBU1870305.1 prolipoprotein diacylglyceryl transferase [Candidatus Omnitrophota bacterium]
MYPQICKIGPFVIYSYGLMLVIAFILSVTLAALFAKRQGFHPDVVYNFGFTVFIAGVIGARLFYVIENINYYLENPLEIILLQHGGLSWFGGLVLGTVFGLWYLKKKNIPVLKFLDVIIPFVALGHAIGRIGCFLNGCCYGKPSKFGFYFPAHKAVLIPTQLISVFILLIIFIFLRTLQRRPHHEGQILFAYLFLFSIKRFFIEFLRADNPQVLWGLTLFQLLSIVVFCIGITGFFMVNKKGRKVTEH